MNMDECRLRKRVPRKEAAHKYAADESEKRLHWLVPCMLSDLAIEALCGRYEPNGIGARTPLSQEM
ncbi:MAG: hypothetical protein LZF86_100225 [Nitrospira sp.]|nr:MAG: hypothetical protein LZF86_100225 [Nitrospira sp.]